MEDIIINHPEGPIPLRQIEFIYNPIEEVNEAYKYDAKMVLALVDKIKEQDKIIKRMQEEINKKNVVILGYQIRSGDYEE
jgi:hypothetical protein